MHTSKPIRKKKYTSRKNRRTQKPRYTSLSDFNRRVKVTNALAVKTFVLQNPSLTPLKKYSSKKTRKRKGRKRIIKRNHSLQEKKINNNTSCLLMILPNELFVEISSYLEKKDIILFSLSCKDIRRRVDSRETWIVLYQRERFEKNKKIYSKEYDPKMLYKSQSYFPSNQLCFYRFFRDNYGDYGWHRDNEYFHRVYFSGKYTQHTNSFLVTNDNPMGKMEKEEEHETGWIVKIDKIKKLRNFLLEGKVDHFKPIRINKIQFEYLWMRGEEKLQELKKKIEQKKKRIKEKNTESKKGEKK